MAAPPDRYSSTPDGRYFVVRGRLWRRSNPALADIERERLVRLLMAARRAVAVACRHHDPEAEAQAHADVDATKIALGERGPVWWADGAPDVNRHLARSTVYADWYDALGGATDDKGEGFSTPASKRAGERCPDHSSKESSVAEKKGHGSETAQRANAKAAKDGHKNPRKSSAAQAELGKKGGKTAKH